MTKIDNIYDLVALWPAPSNKNFANDIGVKERAVADMKRRNTIDQKHLLAVYNAAQGRNICLSADQILKVVAAGRKKDTSKQEGGEIAA